jgi:hypothetical protein
MNHSHPHPPFPLSSCINTCVTNRIDKQETLVREGAAYVLSSDDSIRSRAFRFLAQVIEGLPSTLMNATEGSVWLSFFIAKLSDEPCARHALHALAAVCAAECAPSIESIGQLPLRVCDIIHVRNPRGTQKPVVMCTRQKLA